MTLHINLPEIIPIFPLSGALLLPRSRLPLHVFEPCYLAMFEDCLKTPERLIGMIQPNVVPGREGPGLYAIGCVGRVTQFSETEDGRYMITLTGLSRYRVTDEVDGFQPYRRAEVSWDGFGRDMGPAEEDPNFDRAGFLAVLGQYFASRELKTDWDALKDAEDELLINSLSMMLGFEPEDKQALLEAPSLSTRRETLLTLMEFALRGGSGDEVMQ